jgi:dihydrofolate reductase
MRRIVAVEFMSLDGFFEGPRADDFSWFAGVDPEVAGDPRVSTDSILLGRRTYEHMIAYWPTATGHDPMTETMNTLPKIVFSRTLSKVEWGKWNNATLVKQIVAEEIHRMKQQPGKDMITLGSGEIVSTLHKLRLIDEFRIFLQPVLLGGGKPLFRNFNGMQKLELLEAKAFKGGTVGLFYRPSYG